jgi:hypothetical protein
MKEVLEYVENKEVIDMKKVFELVVENPDMENIYKMIKDTN